MATTLSETQVTPALSAVPMRAKPFFVFLMVDQNDKTGDTVVVNKARNFMAMALAYKRGSRKANKPIVKKRIYDWRLELFIGPFPTRELAEKFLDIWVTDLGNINFMRERGLALAQRFNRVCVALRPHLFVVPDETCSIDTIDIETKALETKE